MILQLSLARSVDREVVGQPGPEEEITPAASLEDSFEKMETEREVKVKEEFADQVGEIFVTVKKMKLGKTFHVCIEPGCEKLFNQKIHLEEHGRSAHHHPKLKCQLCDAKFCTHSGRLLHNRKYHYGSNFVCTKCRKVFSRSDYCKDHMREKHNRPMLVCSVQDCGAQFASLGGRSKHMRRKHG
jgi:hypothetical protein